MTEALYLSNTYLFESEAYILKDGEDARGSFVTLDQTSFYPQGGGQPSDQGFLIGQDFQYSVSMVRSIENEIRHYLVGYTTETLKGQKITCQIDKERRMMNARYHTAAHLLGNVVEVLSPQLKAIKGHSFPKEAYVEFSSFQDIPDPETLQSFIKETIQQGHKTRTFKIDPLSFEQQFYKLPYVIPENKAFRVMQIGNFAPVPCGGTHLASTDQIGNMIIGKIKLKSNSVRISYELA